MALVEGGQRSFAVEKSLYGNLTAKWISTTQCSYFSFLIFPLDNRCTNSYTNCISNHHTVKQHDRGESLFITLNYKSRTPICDQLCESIIQLAGCGAMAPGDPLPSVRSLAQELGINPNTVQKSYRLLEQQGILESIPGKGSFIARGDGARDTLRSIGEKALEEGIDTALSRGLTPQEIRCLCDDYLTKKEGQSND